jgi:hypothetical protein
MSSVNNNQRKKITSIFLTGKVSATMVIPIETARKYGLVEGSHVIIEEASEGILIRKLELQKGENY